MRLWNRDVKKQTGDISGSLNNFRTLIIYISAPLGCDFFFFFCAVGKPSMGLKKKVGFLISPPNRLYTEVISFWLFSYWRIILGCLWLAGVMPGLLQGKNITGIMSGEHTCSQVNNAISLVFSSRSKVHANNSFHAKHSCLQVHFSSSWTLTGIMQSVLHFRTERIGRKFNYRQNWQEIWR